MVSRLFRLTVLAALLFLALALSTRAAPLTDAPTGSISGTVTQQVTRLPLKDAEVCVYELPGGGWRACASTDAAGRYKVDGLLEDEYRLCFSRVAHISRCDYDLPGGATAGSARVGPGESVTGIDAALTQKPRIRGRVSDLLNGAAVANVRVTALRGDGGRWAVAAYATTDASGHYEIAGLWGGSFRLRFTDGKGSHAERYFPDARSVERAQTIGVPSIGVVDGVDMKLPRLGSLSGRVQGLRTGEALEGIAVTLNVWPPMTTVTDRIGAFEFVGLKEREYKVAFTDPTRAYARCNYSGAPGFCEAIPVQVTDGEATTGINQKLPETGGLLATVLDAATGAPLSGIDVILYGKGYQDTVQAKTDAAGQVRMMKIDPETYPMELRDPSERYASVWPGDVVIRPGEAITVTWQLQPISPPQEGPRAVRGRITDAETGAPLANIRMVLECFEDHWLHPHWYEVASTITAADGSYDFDEPPAAERLLANDDSDQYEQVMLSFHNPEPGETVVADGAMTKYMSKYGRFAGRVTTNAGASIASSGRVEALRQDATDSFWGWLNENGEYSFYAPPGIYKLQFLAWNPYLSEFYADAATVEAAQALTLTVGQTITADASLAQWGRFAGRVTDSAGQPIKGAWVGIYKSPWQTNIANVWTDDQGRYISPYLEDGEYRVRFAADGYDEAVWGGGYDVQTGADVSVRVDTLVEGIDVALGPLGAITGRVVDRLSGAPLPGIGIDMGWFLLATTDGDGAFTLTGVRSGKQEVFARDASGKYPTQSFAVTVTAPLTTTVEFPLDLPGHVVGRVSDIYDAPLPGVEVTFQQSCCWSRTVKTDAEGRYDSGPLPGHHNYREEFDYIIAFGDRGERYKVEYYDNAATAASARPVTVAPATTVEANATVDTLGRITGRVTDKATGLPVARVRIWIDDARYVNTDDDGRYVIEGIRPDSTVTLRFDADGYVSVSIPVSVALNATLENQDVPLTPWGKLSGRVTDARTGRPLAGIWVKLYLRGAEDSWYAAYGTTTDANGNYALAPHGQTYRVEFADPREVYRGEAYPDAPTIQEGADVIFTPGEDAPNINVALAPTDNAPIEPNHVYLPMIVR